MEYYAWWSVILVGVAALGMLAILTALWLVMPHRLAKWRSAQEPAVPMDVENSYRTALAQLVGFPLALLGAVATGMAVYQAIKTYQGAAHASYQQQYQQAFQALTSSSSATRIGGLYSLQGLLSEKVDVPAAHHARADLSSSATQVAGPFDSPDVLVLRSMAAFAVDHPAAAKKIIPSDSLTALQILAWRKSSRDTGFDLRNGEFRGAVLARNENQAYADLRKFDLHRTDFSGSDLYCAHFYEANLQGAKLDGANLVNAVFSRANLSNASFALAINESVPSLSRGLATPAILKNALFVDASGTDTKFTATDLQCAVFRGSTFVRPDFTNANLSHADLKGQKWQAPIFKNAWLIATDLTGTGLREQDLAGAHLCDVIGTAGQRLNVNCSSAQERTDREQIPVCGSPEEKRASACPGLN